MSGADHAQTRIADIKGLSKRVAMLENSPMIQEAVRVKLLETKQEALVFLLGGGHPGSEWNEELRELASSG